MHLGEIYLVPNTTIDRARASKYRILYLGACCHTGVFGRKLLVSFPFFFYIYCFLLIVLGAKHGAFLFMLEKSCH